MSLRLCQSVVHVAGPNMLIPWTNGPINNWWKPRRAATCPRSKCWSDAITPLSWPQPCGLSVTGPLPRTSLKRPCFGLGARSVSFGVTPNSAHGSTELPPIWRSIRSSGRESRPLSFRLSPLPPARPNRSRSGPSLAKRGRKPSTPFQQSCASPTDCEKQKNCPIKRSPTNSTSRSIPCEPGSIELAES